ncbi:glycosyltransferase [uncultured Bacteroides sp.]|uniref:glycosyltransferase n=1 Tax=uncultured Bacteroides sp. TaxID=162156 RepID=UPI002AA64755|nr:glycosyltransferase [uncultured Bacteroides sp.]
MEALAFNTTELILLSASGILFIIQAIYYFGLYNRIHAHNKAVKKDNVHFTQELPPISVIICAKNESENLRRNLPAILEQDYPEFEVIVINDGSTDESEELLNVLEEKYSHLYHSFTPESSRYISRKKLALTLGIKASKHDWLVFTEANCHPVSNQWLRLMARNFTSRTEVVLGYSGYERGKGWLHKRVAFDSLFTSLSYLSWALAGKPYIGFGRNMAYRKELFFNTKGFSAHLNLQRGDDDLFINQVAKGNNTRVETDANATVKIQLPEYYRDWKEEKVSYTATAKYYKGGQQTLLKMETITRLLFHLVFVATMVLSILSFHWFVAGVALLVWLLRYTIQAIIINRTATEMGDNRHYYFTLPAFDFLLPLQSLKFRLYRLYRGKGDFMRR